MLKSVLDGAVAAFHVHDGSDLAELSHRVAAKLDVTAADVANRLMAAAPAALGPRRLLYRFRSNVQWNPADNLCVVASLQAVEDPEWGLLARLSAVEPQRRVAASDRD
jgi:hypothetical protein